MRILYVLSEPAYPDVNGIRLKSYNSMCLMAEENEIAVATLIPPEVEPYDIEKLQELTVEPILACDLRRSSSKATMARAMFRGAIYYMERFRSEEFRTKLKALIAEFKPDAIHFDWILMTQYLDCVPAGVGAVASVNDCVTLSKENEFRSGVYRFPKPIWFYRKLQYRQVRRFETKVYPKFDSVHLMTAIDAGRLKQLNPNITTKVIPNGTPMTIPAPETLDPTNREVITVSKLTPTNTVPMEHFLRQSWPIVRAKCPEAIFRIVGRETPATQTLRTLAERVGGVVFEGFVENLADVYMKTSIALNLVNKNCGLINKVIEGMAKQQCVVGFRLGFAGLSKAVNGHNCLMADSYEEIAKKLLWAMENSNNRIEIQVAARKTAEENFSWDAKKPAYDAMYREAIQSAQQRANR